MTAVPTIRSSRTALLSLAGLGLIGALAGCSGNAVAEGADTGTDAGSGSSADTGTGGDGTYADGTYEADGSYTSPGGQESVGVSITLEDDVVTAVTVTPHATSGNAKQFQTQFAGAIAGEVVGKDIDSLEVSRVAGSSLTSGGFNDALEAIKADAAS
ncbi:hypothetical protein [Naasia sp. SYSU D00057]|uniref:FMN-binding protein n=1 Tax=Naasia sp. SYSU D00057 TaxID=2817380 RepID=UPI001B317230|nr:hypothetical protein [Naasia sp. SYSU D00057]